jgi:hypothetical protein
MKGELRWRGANSISKFDHHNINGGVPTILDVTGRRLLSTSTHEISMISVMNIRYSGLTKHPLSTD